MTTGERTDVMRVGRLDLLRIVVQQLVEDVIFREFERSNEGSIGDFLEVESDRHEACESFDAFQRGSFECSKYPDSGSSLHFIEDFHVI